MILSGSKNNAGCCCGCTCTTTPQCNSLGYCNPVQFGSYCGYNYPVRTWLANCLEVFSGGSQCPNQPRGFGSVYVIADSDSGTYYDGSFCPDSECNDIGTEYSVCSDLFCEPLAQCLACEYYAMLYGNSSWGCDQTGGVDPDPCGDCESPPCPNTCECPCYVP